MSSTLAKLMKFSLQLAFAIATLSCLVAFIFQQASLNRKLEQENARLNAELDVIHPCFEVDLPYLRVGAATDRGISNLIQKNQVSFDSFVSQRQAQPFDQAIPSIRSLPDLNWSKNNLFVNAPNEFNVEINVNITDRQRHKYDYYGKIAKGLFSAFI